MQIFNWQNILYSFGWKHSEEIAMKKFFSPTKNDIMAYSMQPVTN